MSLHLVKSTTGYLSCLNIATEQDAVLLLNDATYLLCQQQTPLHPHIFALETDLAARNILHNVPNTLTIIDYSQMVELSIQHNNSMTW